MLLSGMLVFTSCDDDRDSNPTLTQPTTFVLNNPAVGSGAVDLALSKDVNLTWSQPTEYTTGNAPVVVTYTVQLSPSGTFTQQFDENKEDNTGADFIALDATTTDCVYDIPTADIATALQKVAQWEENAVPATQDVAVRIKGAVKNASGVEYYPILSNIVNLKTVPYYVELKNADPELWWLIGGDICDGSWGSDIGKCVIPLQTMDNPDYDKKTGRGEILWTGYLAGNGFKLRGSMTDNWATQWGQGDAFGEYKKNDGGSGNITVPAAGYYTVKLNTATDVLTVTEYKEAVTDYASICVSGDFNEWGDTPMTPCMASNNHDWYTTVTLDGTQGIKFKEAGSWGYNTGGPVSQTAAGDLYGYGTNNGENIYPAAGTYLVIYNDITRYYRFILQ